MRIGKRIIISLALALFAGASLQAAPITEGQWLQLNFTDGWNPAGKDNFNYFIDSSDGLKVNETTGTSTTLIDSLGNTVDGSLSASGWAGAGGNNNAAWAGMGTSTPAPGTSTWSGDEINNFWYDSGTPDNTVTIGGLDTNLTYNVYYYSKLNAPTDTRKHTLDINGTTQTVATRGDRFLDAGADLLFENISLNGSGELLMTWGADGSYNPFVNSIVIQAITPPVVGFVGDTENTSTNGFEVGRWSRTNTVKTLDIDGDNFYGTDGYTFMNTNNMTGFIGPLDDIVNSTPDYLTPITFSGPTNGTFFGSSSSFAGAQDALVPTDGNITMNVGYAGVRTDAAVAIPLQDLFTYTMNRATVSNEVIRMGIITDSLGDIKVGVTELAVIAGGVTNQPMLSAGNQDGTMDMYFFDLSNLSSNATITIQGANSYTNAGFHMATIGGITFDSVITSDVTPTAALLSIVYAAGNVTVTADNIHPFVQNQLQGRENLASGGWDNVGSATTGVSQASWVIPASNAASFYQVESFN